jgi:hypothetical protein
MLGLQIVLPADSHIAAVTYAGHITRWILIIHAYMKEEPMLPLHGKVVLVSGTVVYVLKTPK